MIGKGHLLSTVVASSLICSACVATVRPVAPPPRMEVVYVDREPPPARVELIAAAPGDDHIWVQGHWVWLANRREYEWSPGHWRRLEPGERWVAGHWVHEQRGWYFVEGRVEPVVYVARRPPAVRDEVIVARPSPEHVWIKGYWGSRNGEFEWIAGHWARPEPGFHAWVDGRWEHENRGWFFVEGHWKA
jgi:WXXGXW repeat (2 copies)